VKAGRSPRLACCRVGCSTAETLASHGRQRLSNEYRLLWVGKCWVVRLVVVNSNTLLGPEGTSLSGGCRVWGVLEGRLHPVVIPAPVVGCGGGGWVWVVVC
jgi:hypothetical protein